MPQERKKFPFAIEDVDEETNRKICNGFVGELCKHVRVGPGKMLIYDKFRNHADDYYNLKLRPNDIIVSGFSRSGTTLTEEIVWYLANGLDMDRDKAKKITRVPWLEARSMMADKTVNDMSQLSTNQKCLDDYLNAIEILEAKTERRVYKTHLHLDFLPSNLLEENRKVVYIARNPKDVCVSFFHLHSSLAGRKYNGTFEEYYRNFRDDLDYYSPYFTHIAQAWEKRNNPHVKFLFYEDLTRDMKGQVSDLAKFLNVKLTPKQLDQVEKNFQLDPFRKFIGNKDLSVDGQGSHNHAEFIRKGVTGGWRSYFNQEMCQDADRWIAENCAKYGIKFPEGV